VTGISLLLFLSVAHTAPLTFSWSGDILEVFEDTGTTRFSGTQVSDAFSGSFVYDTLPGTQLSGCDSTVCEWLWDDPQNVGAISGGPGPVDGVFLIVENDQDLSENPEDLEIINSILDPDIDENTPFDLWELSSDLFSEGDLLFFSVVYITTDTSAIADASIFDAMPPFDAMTPSAGRAAAFVIQEDTADGSFFAVGLLDAVEITAIPVPAAVWLFGSALGLLGWVRRRDSAVA